MPLKGESETLVPAVSPCLSLSLSVSVFLSVSPSVFPLPLPLPLSICTPLSLSLQYEHTLFHKPSLLSHFSPQTLSPHLDYLDSHCSPNHRISYSRPRAPEPGVQVFKLQVTGADQHAHTTTRRRPFIYTQGKDVLQISNFSSSSYIIYFSAS